MKKVRSINIIRIALALFFLFAAILPLLGMLVNLANPEAVAVFTSSQFSAACLNSLLIAFLTMLLTVFVALLASWVLCRTRVRLKGVFAAIMTLPMLVPSLALGMSLVFLLGSNGIITNALGIDLSIYGYNGIIVGEFLYSFPPAFLLIYDVMRNEDAAPYEAAAILGIPKLNQFTGITLPYLKKPLISALFATFTLVITDYGVPLMVGGKVITLPVLMYQEVIGLLNFNTGVAIGFVLLIPAIIAFLIDVINQENARVSFVITPRPVYEKRSRDIFGYIVLAIISIAILLPIAIMLFVSFSHKYPLDISFTLANIGRSLNLNAGAYWINSIVIALSVSVLGTAFAYFAGYITSRIGGKLAKALHLVCITTLAIPGIVLGISYIFAFKGTFLYATIGILILVNIVHFFASPYLLAYNALGKLNLNLEAAGQTLGVSRMHMIKDVIAPQTLDTIIEMFSFFFVNCMVTISAVAFLATTVDMPLALLITDFDAQRLTECAAFVSLLILFTNIVFKVALAGIKKLYKYKIMHSNS